MIDDLQQTDNQVERPIRREDYRRNGQYSPGTIENRFGSWVNGCRKAQVLTYISSKSSYEIPDYIVDAAVDALSDLNGWYKSEELVEIVPCVDTIPQLSKILQAVEEADTEFDFHWNASHGQRGSRAYIQQPEGERHKEYREKLPEGSEEVFQQCISMGRSPQATVAAIKYLVDDGLTQVDAAEEAGCSHMGLRSTRDFILSEGLDEQLSENNDATQVN